MKHFLLTMFLILFFDFFWLSCMGSNFISMLENVQKGRVHIDYKYGMLTYLIISLMISAIKSSQYAAILGFYTYAVYHLINLATFKNWKVSMAIADTLWGTCLFYTVSYLKLNLLL